MLETEKKFLAAMSAVGGSHGALWHDSRLQSTVASCWSLMAIAVATVPILLTAPFYICALYDEWYIDEMFAIVRNPDAIGESPFRAMFTNDFWGQSLWPVAGGWTHKSYRPLVILTFRAQLALQERNGGLRPGPLRAANCAVHSLNVALLQLLLSRVLRVPWWWSMVGVALFALHPVHLENLPYLVGRADSLATTFILAGLLCRRHSQHLFAASAKTRSGVVDGAAASAAVAGGPRGLLWRILRRRYASSPTSSAASIIAVAAWICAPLGGLCKETGLTLPALLAWDSLLSLRRGGTLMTAACDLAWLGALASVRVWYVGGVEVGFSFVDTPVRYAESVRTRVLSYSVQHARYAQLLVLPWHLSWDYSYDALPLVQSLTDVRLLSICAAYGGATAATAWAAGGTGLRMGSSRTGLLGVGLALLPFGLVCSNLFFLVGTTVAERLLYPSTAGWVLFVAALGARLEGWCGQLEVAPFAADAAVGVDAATAATEAVPAPVAAVTTAAPQRSWRCWLGRWRWRMAVCLLAALYAWRAGVRTWQWRSKVTLFRADMQHWRRSAKVTHLFASLLHGGGRLHEALVYYDESLAIFDDNAVTDYCIAQIQLQLRRYPEAQERFEKIARGHGIGLGSHNMWMVSVDYGWLLTRLGRYSDAVAMLEKGMQLRPDLAYAWNALGIARASLGDFEGAMHSLLQGVELEPLNALIWSNAAAVANAAGSKQQAVDAMRNAVALDPSDPRAARNAMILLGGAQGQLSLDLFLQGQT